MLFKLDISESGAEYASDAAEYFNVNISSSTVCGKSNIPIYIYYNHMLVLIVFNLCLFILETNLNDLKSLRNVANWKQSLKHFPILPSMSEDRFVALCKTMYNLIENAPIDQEMHNNISKISNLYTFLKLSH